MDKQAQVFQGFDSETLVIKGNSQNKNKKAKLQAYLFLALEEGEEISPETVKFAPIIVSDLETGIREFEEIYKGHNIIGITPLATLIKQMTILEIFAEKNGYDYNELIENSLELINEDSDNNDDD